MNKIFKYFSISYWKTRNKYRKILEWIKSAKRYYINTRYEYPFTGMCFAFNHTANRICINISYNDIEYIIPEFNPTYLNAPRKEGYWWIFDDYKSRIKAFDKLIDCYKNKIKEL